MKWKTIRKVSPAAEGEEVCFGACGDSAWQTRGTHARKGMALQDLSPQGPLDSTPGSSVAVSNDFVLSDWHLYDRDIWEEPSLFPKGQARFWKIDAEEVGCRKWSHKIRRTSCGACPSFRFHAVTGVSQKTAISQNSSPEKCGILQLGIYLV